MSNAKSPSRSRSRSGSRSRSRSFSHSRTRSRSWSRKHRYSSRSRSQSRSRSASYSRDRNYGKEYQNNRGFRGYNRGYRRPYYYRGRGFFPRGRYQRGVDGYGYGCGTYRHNNWQDYRGQQQPVGEKEPRSPRRARSRSRTPRKRSGSPHSRSRSRRSNRSSSGLSCHSSSSSSRYSSPKCHGKGKKERKSKGKQMSRTSCVPSLPRASPQLRSAIVIGQGAPVSTHVGPSPSAAMGSSVAPWKSIGPVAPGESPPEAALAGAFSGFGFFSKGSLKAREKSAVSPAFHKFLVEHQNKEGPEWERGLNPFDGERERGAAKPTGLVHSSPKAEKEAERKEHKQLCFWPQGVKEPGEQRGDTPPTGRLMAEALGRWEASNPAATDVPGPDNEEGGNLEKELYYSRKRERTTAATSRERAVVGKDSFPEWLPRGSTKERPVDSPPRARPPMWNWKEEVFGHRGSPLCYKLASCAETVAKERRLCQDLVHHKPKEQEFRSIFQHIEAAQFQRSPSEVFAQHMVAIVHHVKARHFRPSELTLHDRFSLYLRQAAESDMKPWKSPEIHRRINVSPSTFKRHSHVFEDTRSCRDVDYKATQDAGARRRSLSSDLQVDQEQAASYSGRERAAAKTPEDSSVSSRGRFSEKPAKHHKKSKKSKKKRSHSSSCSAEHRLQDSTSGVETFSKVHGALFDHDAAESSQDHKGFFGMKSRGWSMGNYCRNHTDSDPSDTVVGKCPSVVEWDTECMPKSKKYHLHDDRVMEGKWLEHGPHGQGQHTQVPNSFLYHKGNGNPKWAPDNLQVTMEEGELQEDGELEPPEGGIIAPKH